MQTEQVRYRQILTHGAFAGDGCAHGGGAERTASSVLHQRWPPAGDVYELLQDAARVRHQVLCPA
eukprot:679829-Pyramimonas_sp.AAC.1